MKKKQRTSKSRALPAAELDAMHDAGVALSAHVDLGKAIRPGRAVQRVNVDFPVDLPGEIYQEGRRLGVTTQAFIKGRLADSLVKNREVTAHMSEAPNNEPLEALLCTECLEDRGLSPDAHSFEAEDGCPLSTLRLATTGRKLDRDSLLALARSSAAFRVYAPRFSAAARAHPQAAHRGAPSRPSAWLNKMVFRYGRV